MICVTVFTDSDSRYVGIQMIGHAGLAENPAEGQELVCSAVSALTINMANSIERFTEDEFQTATDEKDGGFTFRFTSHISAESMLLMNSLVSGLMDIEEEYGEPYIRIRIEEV